MAKKCTRVKSLFDDTTYVLGGNALTAKIPRKAARYECAPEEGSTIKCVDAGKACVGRDTKTNIIANESAPQKLPEEETFSIRAIRRVFDHDDLKNTLQIEWRAPRNYRPLPEEDPSWKPPVTKIATVHASGKKDKGKKKGKGKK